MYSNFGFLSYEISHSIRQRFNKKAEKLGISYTQWRALAYLVENQNCRQVDLAEILQVKPISLARHIDLFEESGLVQRIKDSEDRRAYRLQLTQKAKSLLESLEEIADAVETQVLGFLNTQDREFLTRVMTDIKNNLSR